MYTYLMPINLTLREQLCAAYDAQAVQRDSADTQPWKICLRAAFLELLQREGGRTLLEIGSGPGRDGLFFQEHGLQVTCTDLSPEMVRLCRAKGLDARVMDAAALDFPAASFDAYYALNSLLHIPNAELPEVLRGMAKLLKPSGIAFIGTYGGRDSEGIWENDWNVPKRFFSFRIDDTMREFLESCFEILSFERIETEGRDDLHFQAFTVRKKEIPKWIYL
jgi:SAM-dependent methyltransferase